MRDVGFALFRHEPALQRRLDPLQVGTRARIEVLSLSQIGNVPQLRSSNRTRMLEPRRTANLKHMQLHRLMLNLVMILGVSNVRTTVNIDDELLAKATKLIGPMDRTALVSEGLKALIERESARHLARLGGTQPQLKAAPRRRQGRAE